MSLATWLLLDLGCVKERGDDRCRADPNRDASFDELGPALLVLVVRILFVGHVLPTKSLVRLTSMCAAPTMEAAR